MKDWSLSAVNLFMYTILRIILGTVLAGSHVLSAAEGPTFKEGVDPKPEGKKWVAVPELSDDFDGDSVDSSKWQTEPRGNGWSWIGRPPGLFRAENVTVADGRMKVRVGTLSEPVVRDGHTYTYEGAIVRSIHPCQVGWYYECRMKANATEMSSTFWLMTKGRTKKKLELDVQECVGTVSPKAFEWAKDWDHIFHSNVIHRRNRHNPEKVQRQAAKLLDEKNHERFFVYAAWWKSPEEIQFFLDGEYTYSVTPSVSWDVPAYIQMAIETYDWNPVPDDGGLVASGTSEQRMTQYDWVRVWKLEDK